MILRTIEHDRQAWTVCLGVGPSSPGATGLELVFVGGGPDGERIRYALAIEGEVLEALAGEGREVEDSELRHWLVRALESGRLVDEMGREAPRQHLMGPAHVRE